MNTRIVMTAISVVGIALFAGAEATNSTSVIKTGVYAGRGISGNGATEWFRIVERSPDLTLKIVDSEMIRAGGLDGLDVFVMPGGSSPDIKKDLGTNGVARLREFIKNGGGYFGTCAGCCLMMEEAPDPSRGIGVMPFYRSGSKGRFLIPVELNTDGAAACANLLPGKHSVNGQKSKPGQFSPQLRTVGV